MDVPPPTHLPLRALVVDDDPDNADLLGAIIGVLGDDVRVAYDAPSALDVAKTFLPIVALLDLAMPQFTGLDLLQLLEQLPELSGIRFVAVSGFCDEAHRNLAFAAGFSHYLTKPYSLDQVRSVLDEVRSSRPS